jgi:hypothetical protein
MYVVNTQLLQNGNPALDYVCLEDANIILSSNSKCNSNTPAATISIPFWIGKLESVDGFFIGEIAEEDPSAQSLV